MNTKIERIWFELINLKRWDLCWEQMEERKDGEYILREEVIALVEKYLISEQPTAKDAEQN